MLEVSYAEYKDMTLGVKDLGGIHAAYVKPRFCLQSVIIP